MDDSDHTKMELLAENSSLRDRNRQLEKSLMDLRGIIETRLPEVKDSNAMRVAYDLLGFGWHLPSDEDSADRQRIRTGGTDIPEGGE